MKIHIFLYVMVAGAAGVGLRYLATTSDEPTKRAIIIASINALGSFAIGYFITSMRESSHTTLLPVIAVGLLGGLTTFSSFSFDVVTALDDSRFMFAATLFAGTVMTSFVFCYLGILLGRKYSF